MTMRGRIESAFASFGRWVIRCRWPAILFCLALSFGLISGLQHFRIDNSDEAFLPKNDPDVLRRNALIGLGNQADLANVGVIAAFLGHHNPVLRAHAAWALGRMDDDRTSAALRSAHQGETDETVRKEIEAALNR